MRGFDTPFLLSGLNDQQTEDRADYWKRFVTAALMAGVALLLCAIIVVMLAPILPNPTYVSHTVGLGLPSGGLHARI